MAPTIPPEIWLRIARFIPSSILRNLYSLNRLFLDLALNERYSDVNLNLRWTAATTTFVKHLRHPHVAHRVRQLTLASNWVEPHTWPHIYESEEPSEKVTSLTAVAWNLPFDLGRYIDPIVRRISNIKICSALIEATIVNFPNLSSLIIREGGPSSRTRPDPLLLKSYTAYASNLRTLELSDSSANFDALFPPNAFELMSLEEVILSFPQNDSGSDAEAVSTFFRGIASTLTTLTISFHGTSNEPPRLLQSFRQGGKTSFPKLRSFSLYHSVPPDSPSPNIVEFLNQHADTLKYLRLQHTKLPPFASHDLPVLPHLETLKILDGSSYGKFKELPSSLGLDVVRAYIQHSESTLTSLCLTNCSFTLHDLGRLLDLLGRGSSENTEGRGLKRLTVTVQVLSPQVLDMLAEKLPHLGRLKVRFVDLRSNDGADVPMRTSTSGDLMDEDIERFRLEMETRSYSRWSLRSFEIHRGWWGPDSDTAMAILMPLTLRIPHLVEIRGGPFVKMSKEPGCAWKENDSETLRPAVCYFQPRGTN